MNVNEMSTDELRKLRMELQATMSEVTDRLETLKPKPVTGRGDSWSVTLKRMVQIPETAVVVVKAATQDEAQGVAEAVADDCLLGDDLDWNRESSDEEIDDLEVDWVEPSDDPPAFRLDGQGNVVAIDEEDDALRVVADDEEDEG